MLNSTAYNIGRAILVFGAISIFNLTLISQKTMAQIPAIRQINLRQGLPQSEVSCMLEDRRGYIWAGTRGGGLVQLNGNSLRVFNSAHGLENNFISDIRELPDGRLLVSSLYGGIQWFDGEKFSKSIHFTQSEDLLKTEISDNDLVFGIQNKGVSVASLSRRKTRSIFSFPDKVSKILSSALVGKRWLLVSVDSGLFCIDSKSKDRSLFLGRNSHLKMRQVKAIQPLNNHTAVLISADGSTAVLDYDQGWPLISEWKPISGFRPVKGEEVRFVIFGLGQYIKWISTSQNRLISFKSGILDLSRLNGMKIPPISTLMSDRNGSVWLGTLGSGILIKPIQSAFSYSDNPHLAYGRLNAVLKSKEGVLFCGGPNTGLIVSTAGKKETICLFPESDVKSIAESKNYIFVGTTSGIRVLRKKDLVQENYFNDPGNTIRIKELSDGKILIGTFGNGIWIMNPGKKPTRLFSADSGPGYAYEFLESGKGEWLIASNDGLWKYRAAAGILDKLPIPSGIPGSFFMGTRDLFGNFWFAVPDGIARLKGKNWTLLTVKKGLSSSLIYTLNADSVGNVWVGGNRGLDKIALDQQGQVREIINYGPEEGFDGYETNMRASYVSKDFLYVCTIQGLFAMPVKEPMLDPLPQKPEITAFISGSRNRLDSIHPSGVSWFHTGGSGYKLQQPDLLIFDFGNINPVFPSKVKYSYRITGMSGTWSKPSSDSRATVTGLTNGVYAFEVRSTYDGVIFSEPSSLEFTIIVPWYMGKFVLVPAFLFLFLLAGLYLNSRGKRPETHRFFRRDLKWSDSNGRLFLLTFTIFYPLLPFLAARFDPGVCPHPSETLLVISLLTGLFLISVLGRPGGRKMEILLKAAFFIMVIDSLYSLMHNQLAPFNVCLFFAVSGLAFVLFSKPVTFIISGIFINGFALYCAQTIQNPLFNPISFQLATAGLSIVMMLVMLATHNSEKNLRFAGKVVNDGSVLILAFDLSGNLVYASGNIEAMTGYSPEQLSGPDWKEKILEKESDRKEMESLLHHEGEKDIRVTLKTVRGEFRVFRFQGKSLDQRFRVLLGEDISEKEFLESRFEYLVENATDSIFLTDIKGKILYSNPESTFLLGLKREDLIGRNYTEFVEENHRKAIRSFYEGQIAEKINGSYQEFPVQTRGKQIRWMAFQTSILYQRDGQTVDGLLAIGRDITERIETEQLILIQHKNIADSMAYASRIRSALQPEKQRLSELFNQFAILDEPKDIIGGDFFWLGENGPSTLFVMGDCTGHGVPGAFMTTISMGILRENVRENEHQGLDKILGSFNKSLHRYLGRAGKEETYDFAEIALVSIDYESQELVFISSGIPLYRSRNGEITAFREASRGFAFRFDYEGLVQRIQLEPGDVFYLFTDGVYDQISGKTGKRLSKSKLMKILQDSDQIELENGIAQIKQSIREWQGNSPQTDDRMLISFRF